MHTGGGDTVRRISHLNRGDMMELNCLRGTKALAQHCWLRCLSLVFGNLAGFVQLARSLRQSRPEQL